MGWASAGEIFNPVARALIDLGADAQTKRKVLGTLIRKLQDGDWDTEGESMEEFRDDPVIFELFRKASIGGDLYTGGATGVLDFEDGRWWLSCDDHGQIDTAGDSAEGHDLLVRLWAEHCRDHHGGDGVVEEDLLINPAGDLL